VRDDEKFSALFILVKACPTCPDCSSSPRNNSLGHNATNNPTETKSPVNRGPKGINRLRSIDNSQSMKSKYWSQPQSSVVLLLVPYEKSSFLQLDDNSHSTKTKYSYQSQSSECFLFVPDENLSSSIFTLAVRMLSFGSIFSFSSSRSIVISSYIGTSSSESSR
jgi:hypothetical protein